MDFGTKKKKKTTGWIKAYPMDNIIYINYVSYIP